MSNGIYSEVFLLPSVKKFLLNVIDRLDSFVSAIVLLPGMIDDHEVRQNLQDQAVKSGLMQETLDLSTIESDRSPLAVMIDFLGLEWKNPTAPITVEQFPDNVCLSEFLPDIIHIGDVKYVNLETIEKWINFFDAWSQLVKKLKDKGKRLPPLCMVLKARMCKKKINFKNLFTKVFYWWGIPSVFEMRILCHKLGLEENNHIHQLWREHILPSLCMGDFDLFRALFDEKTLSEKQLTRVLMEIAGNRGWNKTFLEERNVNSQLHLPQHGIVSDNGATPKRSQYPLWAEGVADMCPEYGFSVSAVALKVLGRHEEIKHRLWSAQAQLIMPHIDRLRIMICHYLTEKYGRDWPVCYLTPLDRLDAEALSESSYNCQQGHLETVLNSVAVMNDDWEKYGRYIKKFRRLRNNLAHNRSISYWKYKEFIDDMKNYQKELAKIK